MKLLRLLYTIYGMAVFIALFLIMFIPLLVPIIFPKKHRWVGVINRWWARLIFLFVVIPYSIEYRFRLDRDRCYIFCPNHFSYLDIPTLGLNAHNAIFVGKSEVEKVPLFGFMYSRLHITVNRSSLKSKFHTLRASLSAIDTGKSLVIFPEGGIVSDGRPSLGQFKDGPFRVAVEKQIPIVPVTIPYNWIILPPDQFLLRWHPVKVIFHEPIETRGLGVEQIDHLKKKVYSVIHNELNAHLKKYEHRSAPAG